MDFSVLDLLIRRMLERCSMDLYTSSFLLRGQAGRMGGSGDKELRSVTY